MSDLVGQQVSHYQIKAFLGQGRIGTVYQAIDLDNLSLVALKIIYLHLTQEPDLRRRFLQEIKAVPRLDHPSIAKVYEAGVDTQRDILYLAMEYIPGRNLSAYLRQLAFKDHTLGIDEALIIGAQLAEALGYAHQKGLLHQDIRPSVVLFDPQNKPEESGNLPGRAIIGDFALKTILEVETEPFAPSLPYSSPEFFLGKPRDGRSDVYSLGVLLYQLTTGRLPFEVNTFAEAARQHPYQDPPSPHDVRPDVLPVVSAAIMKAMAKKPENRYQSGAEMAEALRQIVAKLPERLAAAQMEIDIRESRTELELAEQLALREVSWSIDEDRVTITKDNPHNLNRQIITIGRGDSNDIILPATSITRKHAQLERTADGWQVRDLGSQNGTYLDGKPLLPDIPEPWESRQTLRIGPFFLHLQLGKGAGFQPLPFAASVTPNEIDVVPGKRTELQVTVLNQGTAVDEFIFEVERLPEAWVTMPPDPLRLRPNDRATVILSVQPPFKADLPIGRSRYLLIIRSKNRPEDRLTIPGTIEVLPPEESFAVSLTPTRLLGHGDCEIAIRNDGFKEKVFTVNGANEANLFEFALWRPMEKGKTAVASQPSNKKAARQGSRFFRRLPAVSRVLNAPRRMLMRLDNAPRQMLSQVSPGLGSAVPQMGLSQKASQMSPSGSLAKTAVSPPPANYEKVKFPDELVVQVASPAGAEETVRVQVRPRKRPFWAQQNQTRPFAFQISTAGQKSQTVTGQLEVKPRIRSRVWPIILLLLLLIACLGGMVAYLTLVNRALASAITAPGDLDGDGLSNFDELYVQGTNPREADTDHDGLPDGRELELGTNPNLADTDGDGLTDAKELTAGTDPLSADTDNDRVSDGLEVNRFCSDPLQFDAPLSCTPTPAPTPTFTPRPTSSPTPPPTSTPSAFTETLFSRSAEDGHVVQDTGLGWAAVNTGPQIQVGEGSSGVQQYKGFLSFDTADLPDTAVIRSVRLRLFSNEISGAPYKLGVIYADVAPENGFNGRWALENEDFLANAAVVNAGVLSSVGGSEQWADLLLNEDALQAINLQGNTQFRLYFTLPNNQDGAEDWIRFYSGDNSETAVKPQLIIDYVLP